LSIAFTEAKFCSIVEIVDYILDVLEDHLQKHVNIFLHYRNATSTRYDRGDIEHRRATGRSKLQIPAFGPRSPHVARHLEIQRDFRRFISSLFRRHVFNP